MDTFKMLNGSLISKEEILSIITKLLHKVIETNTPYVWYETEEPFINMYSGNLSYDYSGEVRKMSLDELTNIKEKLGLSEYAEVCYVSELDELLSEIYIDQWEASYMSNRGKNWMSFKNLIEQDFNNWKYENFEVFDEDGEEIVEDLDIMLDDVLVAFLEETHYDLYFRKIANTIK